MNSPNGKLISRFILTVVFFGMGIWFLRHEKAELSDVKNTLFAAHWLWILAGIFMTVVYISLQSLLYITCFQSIHCKVSFRDTTDLFLKRNFISVFLPAGGVSSLAFFTGPLESKGISKSQIHYASTLYAVIGIISVIVVALPAIIYSFFHGKTGSKEIYALVALIILTLVIILLILSIQRKNVVYRIITHRFPPLEPVLDDISNNHVSLSKLILTLLVSVCIEFAGIAHVYISMKALSLDPSLIAALMAYIISVVFLIISPFLRGLGAVEVSMTIMLTRFGFTNVEAISITLLYRFFEFWLPLISGMLSFMSRLNRLLMRAVPGLMILLLGLINIVSVITPAIHWRLEKLQEYILIDAINASNFFVFMAGFMLLVTAAFLMKGLKSAWWIAMILSIVSLIGHMTKAIDYEEATVALFIIFLLVYTRKEYYIKSNPKLSAVGLQTALISVVVTVIYGISGFYLLHQKHFNIDFSIVDSVRYTLSNYFLVGSSNLQPLDKFGKDFILSINAGGLLSMTFLVYTLIRPYIYREKATDEDHSRSLAIIRKYGKSGLDYFKLSDDKMLFIPPQLEAFIAYRVSGSFAVVLENPVVSDESHFVECVRLFDRFCYENSLKSIYYRVPQESLQLYKRLRKRYMFIGQEAILDLQEFSLEGGSKKSIRNAINKIRQSGYKSMIHEPPVKDGILQKIKAVSDEWLDFTGRNEIIFSQGSFEWDEIKNQTVITVENSEEKVIGFLNIIPDYAELEGTYDLMRKTADAPNGIMDFLMIELISYFKSKGIRFLNMGFAPLSGVSDTQSFRDKSMKFAYERIRAFSQYKGLREYKDKFEPEWNNRYLIYDNDYDLFQVPAALSGVIKK